VYAADGVTPAPAATPEAAVRLFYPWYLGEMMKGRVPLTEERMQDYVAEDTLRDIAFMMNRPNGGKRGLQEDYFLQAKDYFDDWTDHIAVSEVTIDGDTASALVALGDPAQGTKRLALRLVRENGALENLSGERGGSFKIATANPFCRVQWAARPPSGGKGLRIYAWTMPMPPFAIGGLQSARRPKWIR
jgi:hypothetical protein